MAEKKIKSLEGITREVVEIKIDAECLEELVVEELSVERRQMRPPRSISKLIDRWVKRHAPFAQIRRIEALAETVIGDKEKALQWLSEPNPATDDKPPIDLLGDEAGFERVKNLLLRIEYGVLA